jgi:hypothetical protein
MARPTKYTATVRKKLIQAIKMGATYELAAGYAGITYRTFRNWMEQGERDVEQQEQNPDGDPGEFLQFFQDVKAAEAAGAMVWLAKIERAAGENWQAAAWKLERRFPHMYGRSVQEHTGTVEQSLVPSGALAQLADDLLDAVRQIPEARAALAASILGDEMIDG